jgi:hypothetical protein
MNLASDDAEGQARLAAFHQGLQQLGWAVGRNVQIDSPSRSRLNRNFQPRAVSRSAPRLSLTANVLASR